jgi:hypothetical protein
MLRVGFAKMPTQFCLFCSEQNCNITVFKSDSQTINQIMFTYSYFLVLNKIATAHSYLVFFPYHSYFANYFSNVFLSLQIYFQTENGNVYENSFAQS